MCECNYVSPFSCLFTSTSTCMGLCLCKCLCIDSSTTIRFVISLRPRQESKEFEVFNIHHLSTSIFNFSGRVHFSLKAKTQNKTKIDFPRHTLSFLEESEIPKDVQSFLLISLSLVVKSTLYNTKSNILL